MMTRVLLAKRCYKMQCFGHFSRQFASSTRCNLSSSPEDETLYIEQLQLKDIKSPEFYDDQGKLRNYFYYIDLLGRLFTEDTVPKNIATSLKSDKFINFFFKQIRHNDVGNPLLSEYPYISPCGKEMNFIKVADLPIVFHQLLDGDLLYGATLKQKFDPSALHYNVTTGRLYHSFVAPRARNQLKPPLGLLKSHLAIEISQNVIFNDDGSIEFIHGGSTYPVTQLSS